MLVPLACGSGHHHKGPAPTTDSGADAPLDSPSMDAPWQYDSGVPDVAPESGGPFAPAPHDPAPQVVNVGGHVLQNPHVVPVFFANDQYQSYIEQFLAALAQSSYWGSATSEYGVGALTIGPSVVSTATPPTTSYGVDQLISQLASQAGTGVGDAGTAGADGGGDAGTPVPPLTADTVFALFLPKGVTISDSGLGQSCVSYGGYHSETYGGQFSGVAYALIPRCTQFDSLTGMNALTATLSHELVEVATDPHPYSDPAFATVDDAHAVWNLMPYGEIADMCSQEPQSYVNLFGTYVVQLMWSNAAAAAGHDPCVPNTTQGYFNSVPDQPDNLLMTKQGYSTQTRGVKIAVGQSRTIDVHLFSDAPRGQWFVEPRDISEALGGAPELSFSMNPQSGKNGDILKLTITRLASSSTGGSEFMLWSRDQQTNSTTMWFGYVGD